MTHIIYHKDTTKQHYVPTQHVRCYKEDWATEGAAKAARTRAKLDPTVWLIAEIMDFRENIELKETRHNLLSGKAFEVGVNAHYNTCPSSETYHSS
jgi:hypothetical protein